MDQVLLQHHGCHEHHNIVMDLNNALIETCIVVAYKSSSLFPKLDKPLHSHG